jgi:hypothetical protein
MKRMSYTLFAGIVLAGMCTTLATGQNSGTTPQNNSSATGAVVTGTSSVSPQQSSQEPSLGNYARSVRKDKQHAAKQYDNDNIPKNDTISVVGANSTVAEKADDTANTTDTTSSPDANKDAAKDANPDAAKDASKNPAAKVEPGQTAQERQQVYTQWQQKISAQQEQIDDMAHELDLDQREYRLRAAAFYADAGDRLRNQAQWDKDDADYKQKIADKQKAIDDAKLKLNDLQESARQAGVPASQQEPKSDDNGQQ